MSEHLGHDRHERSGAGNVRDGSTGKTVRTDIGEVRIAVPRDRAGTFAPMVVPKHTRRLAGFDEAVLSLYAKGMTTGDIANHLADVYGSEVSRDLVSRVTDAVVEQMQEWQNRPLDAVYPVLLIDAIVLKIRDGHLANRPVYVAMGISVDGERDVLGLWVGPSGGEGAKQWMTMLTELRKPRHRRRVHPLLRRVEGPARGDLGDLGDLAAGHRADLWCTWSATACATHPRPTGQDHRRVEDGLHCRDRHRRGGPLRRVRPDLASQVPGDGRDVGTVLGRVRPVPGQGAALATRRRRLVRTEDREAGWRRSRPKRRIACLLQC
jgi:Transposase, Mutator family